MCVCVCVCVCVKTQLQHMNVKAMLAYQHSKVKPLSYYTDDD